MKKNLNILLILLFIPLAVLRADEGMWLPSLVGELKIGDMQEKGFRLSADDIYHINQAAITDAVVSFGGFCTGELISAEGLLITNHHCGLGSIQQHSSLENNYLDEGFWAMTREDELHNPELYVRFLREVQDVTETVLEEVEDGITEQSRAEIIRRNIRKLQDEATDGTQWKAVTKSFYYGSEYCMFLYEEFNDVRLVGAPPMAIGNFGGDMDNWEWPRHTGDFSIFRIYAGEDNNPATYDAENVPYKSRNFLPVSAGGVDSGDFTMVCGFPGNTDQYLLSSELEMIIGKSLPAKIRIRTERMEVMKDQMDKSDEIQIKYAAKYARVTNAWKKWQ
ncbi:MAG: S46 family peptidase, partial [Bacteroidales bacterium]|nr:S46 family peptidase [Bacteroidales bacterium]